MNYHKQLNTLFTAKRNRETPTLAAMRQLLAALAHPEQQMKCIQIAGTNGKGSCAAMLATILARAGYRVGLFTSPHLADFTERIKVDGREINETAVLRLLAHIRALPLQPSFFETILGMALFHFREKKVDYAIFEAGIGCRWDATSALTPCMTAITSVSLDHTHLLGDTVARIADDKAAIAKPNVPLVTACTGVALEVIAHSCRKNRAPLIQTIPYQGPIGLLGEVQKRNAAVAYTMAQQLGIAEQHIRTGIAKAAWPGRLEFIADNILVDGAHNLAGIQQLTAFVATQSYQRLWIILAAGKRKDLQGMLAALPKSHCLITTTTTHPAARDLYGVGDVHKANAREALAYALAHATGADLILCTGSLFLVGEVCAAYERIG